MVDQARLQHGIKSWAAKAGMSNPRVQCPADEPLKAGSTFHCIVNTSDGGVRVAVTIENNAGYMTWVVG
jgi:hypothetical protein